MGYFVVLTAYSSSDCREEQELAYCQSFVYDENSLSDLWKEGEERHLRLRIFRSLQGAQRFVSEKFSFCNPPIFEVELKQRVNVFRPPAEVEVTKQAVESVKFAYVKDAKVQLNLSFVSKESKVKVPSRLFAPAQAASAAPLERIEVKDGVPSLTGLLRKSKKGQQKQSGEAHPPSASAKQPKQL